MIINKIIASAKKIVVKKIKTRLNSSGIKWAFVYAFIFLMTVTNYSQNHALNWYFGIKAGLNFRTYPPTVLTDGVLAQREGNATISDENGNLLFYTDGVTVWNSHHHVMKNGNGLNGQWIAAQSAIIAKKPKSQGIYYIFTISDWQNKQGGLYYSIIDMNKKNGRGAVIEKNILLNEYAREQISAVYADDEFNVWILTHEKGNRLFAAYKLTETGLSPKPVFSEVGMNYYGTNRYGQLKFSSMGNLVCATLGGYRKTTVQVFSFDQKTGKVSHGITVSKSGIPNAYSSEFSPNEKILYVTSYNGKHLYQFDLSSGKESKIQKSIINLSTSDDVKSCLQIGYDHKIYVSKDRQSTIGVINYPNKIGKACMFDSKAIKMPRHSYCRLGFPNFIQSYFKFYKNINNLSNEELLKEDHLEALTFNIYFESGSAELSDSAKIVLDNIIQILSSHSGYKAIVSSHTDCQGDSLYNLKLSQERAKSSANYLNKKLRKKVNEGIGYGESKPAEKCKCEECTEEQNAKNRRTEIRLIPL